MVILVRLLGDLRHQARSSGLLQLIHNTNTIIALMVDRILSLFSLFLNQGGIRVVYSERFINSIKSSEVGRSYAATQVA